MVSIFSGVWAWWTFCDASGFPSADLVVHWQDIMDELRQVNTFDHQWPHDSSSGSRFSHNKLDFVGWREKDATDVGFGHHFESSIKNMYGITPTAQGFWVQSLTARLPTYKERRYIRRSYFLVWKIVYMFNSLTIHRLSLWISSQPYRVDFKRLSIKPQRWRINNSSHALLCCIFLNDYLAGNLKM
jgi:hypothetical protein